MKEKIKEIKESFNRIQAIRSEIVDVMISDENFVRFASNYKEIECLVSLFPEHKEALYKRVVQTNHFARLTTDIDSVVEFVKIFPEHKEDFFKLVFNPDHSTRLISHYINLRTLTIYFPEYKEAMYQWITRLDNFTRLVDNSIILQGLTTDFPEHQQEIEELLLQPRHFMRIVSSEALRSEFMRHPMIQAYTRGAAIGFFSRCNEGELLPPELADYVGSFLDRKSGGRLAQTRRSAAREASLAEAAAAPKLDEENTATPGPH
ncbi:hypothetical protein [Legionella sp. 29fVS95]|uniref:hypothetical protein n=1 Tax=Legionella sp. 29fVS95 TaxID=3402813 RepID=UPI003AF59484